MTNTAAKLHRGEPPLTGVLRLVRREVADIQSLIARGAHRPLTDTEVHRVRSQTKVARAHWRLLRAATPEVAFRRTDDRLAASARRLASQREGAVRIETFETLARRAAISPAVAQRVMAHLQSHVEADARSATALDSDAAHPLLPLPDVELPSNGQRRLALRALQKTYGRGRKALKRAADTSSSAELLHDFRKQVKSHVNQLSLLRGDDRIRKRLKRSGRLARDLGAHQDLVDLELWLQATLGARLTAQESSSVLSAVKERRARLVARILEAGSALYRRCPRRHRRWLRRHSGSLS